MSYRSKCNPVSREWHLIELDMSRGHCFQTSWKHEWLAAPADHAAFSVTGASPAIAR